MEVIAFMLLVLFMGIIIMVNAFYRSAKKNHEVHNYVLPDLGMQKQLEADQEILLPLVQHVEASLDPTYIRIVKERVMHEHRISETEWENRWFEFKRFLLLTTLNENVPMYSREVDEIWHEMLMFTREYEMFSQKLIGRTLHHAPNISGEGFNQEQRAWFDTIYILLFQYTPYCHESWGQFFKYPLAKEVTDDFIQLGEGALIEKYFKPSLFEQIPPLRGVVTLIIRRLQKQLHVFDQYVQTHGTAPARLVNDTVMPLAEKNASYGMWTLHLFLSIHYYEKFEPMRKVLHKTVEERLKKAEKQKKKEKK